MKILLTGATGFVGNALLKRLQREGFQVLPVVRSRLNGYMGDSFQVKSIDNDTDWTGAVDRVDVIIHTAARAHIVNETVVDPLSAFRKVNVEGTLKLAREAVTAGVKRFIFISTIKVNGEESPQGRPYTEDDNPAPVDPYGVSKLEAEQGLLQLASTTSMEVVTIRPPLVYGPGVKANFQSMMRWVKRGLPLPLGAIDNRRSLLALDNLVDLIVVCVNHPAAANQTFLVSDGVDLSTTELFNRVGMALGKAARLIKVPMWLLKLGSKMVGRYSLYVKLCGSLQVDITKTKVLLSWSPTTNVDDALKETAYDFIEGDESDGE